jgi:hypothetical protein
MVGGALCRYATACPAMAGRHSIVLRAKVELEAKEDGRVMSEGWQLDGEYF